MSLHVFWDNSNIWLVGREVCAQKEPGCEYDFRIHFLKLLEFVRDGREVKYAFVGGSVPPDQDPLWRRFEALGAVVEKQQRGATTGGEVAVDEVIQLEMANRVLDVSPPKTMVLLTGDGAGYDEGKGFIRQLERANDHGWTIEVVSWDAGCSARLKRFAEDNGVYRSLEPAYKQVTFVNNLRWAT